MVFDTKARQDKTRKIYCSTSPRDSGTKGHTELIQATSYVHPNISVKTSFLVMQKTRKIRSEKIRSENLLQHLLKESDTKGNKESHKQLLKCSPTIDDEI